ncbi:Translation initiation factor eIF-2B subunit epsilon [Wickerhamomyces ciferrii]|uniref:Translation initiation factor eIF2B subunit epsilon n=1 Tax=Wickerhamomyces ciferrii (strain ATCC 14091 / BCRC 22168 / CBS 111 / JCM 3599 / NBRC 0793 / NRRL Y-1031 F-60-10) TaxID=1206466 RepID=K0KNB6_WICCF|nr:Translation initiation factor eIF-2B subunit epsilon [Wickerhamomyces ciferrii]CCH46745.1 Translation initiation factor eIF-2B subunit epsilon [Wickerhamomyces ciferrii]
MPPKVKKQKEVVKDERLQAIVLTDSFETRFMPLTSVKPRCLLPLANVPLIEYTLEFLAKAGVDEVYLMCSAHADQIQGYIEQSKWNLPWSPFKVNTIMNLESRSVGDAMRDLDNRGLITGDFLLVSGDVVTNIQFDKVMEAHKARKAVDRDHIATMVLTKASSLHRTRSHAEPATFILDKTNNRCLYYQDIPPADGKKDSVSIDPELLDGVDEFVIRNDLIDCHVDICTPHVPQIFQENFDYQYLRRDFVKSTLSSDILKKTLYAYITDDYAARVESWQTYDAISQDILARWAYPICPDSNYLTQQSYSYEAKHIYKEENVILAQSCKIGSCTAIGSNTIIGDGTYIENSVIGKNCKIGNNITIKNSYIWDNAIIEDNSKLSYSIVANGAKIGNNTILENGSVIGFDVVISNDKTIGKDTRISSEPVERNDQSFANTSDEDEDDEEDDESTHAIQSKIDHQAIVGINGVGYVYESEIEDSDDEFAKPVNSLMYSLGELTLSDDSITSVTQTKQKKKRTMSTTSYHTDMEYEEEEDFDKEAVATVQRAIAENHDLDTALLELNTLRMSMNVTYHEVRLATSTALISKVDEFIISGTLQIKEAIYKLFKHWGNLYKRQAFDQEEEIDLLEILKDLTLTKDYGKQALFHIISVLYDSEIIDEDSILIWWKNAKENYENEYVLKFIDWLEEAEEDSSDEE